VNKAHLSGAFDADDKILYCNTLALHLFHKYYDYKL